MQKLVILVLVCLAVAAFVEGKLYFLFICHFNIHLDFTVSISCFKTHFHRYSCSQAFTLGFFETMNECI